MDEPGPNLSSVTGFPWGSPEGSHLFFLLQHICTKCWYKPIFNMWLQREFQKWPKMSGPVQRAFAVRGHCDPAWVLCFCSLQRPSSLLMQCVSLPWGEPAMQRMSVTSLGSELPGGKNISGKTKTTTAPCPGRGCEKGCEVCVIFGSWSFHSVQCFRLLRLLVLSELPTITRPFTGFKHFQVFTTTSPPQGISELPCFLYCLWQAL